MKRKKGLLKCEEIELLEREIEKVKVKEKRKKK